MSSLPCGTVTFLFTEVEGSTKLARAQLGDVRFEALSSEGRAMEPEQATEYALEISASL